MKIYINSAKENWVVDRFISEWNQYNQKQTKNYYFGKKTKNYSAINREFNNLLKDGKLSIDEKSL